VVLHQVIGCIKIFYPKNKLIIAGGGHKREKLNKIAKILDFHTVIIDDREEYANNERFEDTDEIILGDIGEVLTSYEIHFDKFQTFLTNWLVNKTLYR
jgi:xanthine dehydrogenase accessory factor